MLTMVNRMCWNTRGWRLPTGTSDEGGYPGEHGFGHEEWNFQIEDAVDGFVYGYTHYNPPPRTITKAGGVFRIGFWGLHPETRLKLLVGIYEQAFVPVVEDYDRLDWEFSSRGIYRRRADELRRAVPSISVDRAMEEVLNSVHKRWISFKCLVEHVHFLSEYIPIDDVVRSRQVSIRFANPTFIQDDELPSSSSQFFLPETKQEFNRLSALAEDGYYHEDSSSLEIILHRHNHLSAKFAEWLGKNRFTDIIQREDYVDVLFGKSDWRYRAVVKVCYGVGSTRAIREALEQLVEYNLYPGRENTDRWVIILDEQATSEDIAFIRELKTTYSLPLSLGWEHEEEFVFPGMLGL
jgi:hypothetical protein